MWLGKKWLGAKELVFALCLVMALCGCTSDGGQSGGGTNNETPVCKETSRQNVTRDELPEGFSVSIGEELALYIQNFSAELIDDNGDTVAGVVLEISESENADLEVVRQEKNTDDSTLIEPAIAPLDPVAFECDDFYEVELDYVFRLGSEDSPLIELSGSIPFRFGAGRNLSVLIEQTLDELQGSFEPALVEEGYKNITLHLVLASTVSEDSTEPETIEGSLSWQGEKIHGDPNDPSSVAEAKNEITGGFKQPL